MTVLIKNGLVWDGEQFFYADILTENSKIKEIANKINGSAEFVFDAKGKIVSTGLVDAHLHMRSISSEKYGIDVGLSCIPFGVTAAADASGIYGDKYLLDSFLVKNRVFVCSEIKNNKAYFKNALSMMEKYQNKAIGVKVYYDTTVSEIKDLSPLLEIIKFAEKNNLMVMVHTSHSPVSMPELLKVLRKGDILTHAYHGGKNNISEDNFAAVLNAQNRGVVIDTGLAGNVHVDFKILKNAISKKAIPNIISSDLTRCSAYKRGGKYSLLMCMSIARHRGMCEEDVFRAVTSAPAKALGAQNEWGYLKTGRNADITVLEYGHECFDLTDSAHYRIAGNKGYKCLLTVVDGEIVYKR